MAEDFDLEQQLVNCSRTIEAFRKMHDVHGSPIWQDFIQIIREAKNGAEYTFLNTENGAISADAYKFIIKFLNQFLTMPEEVEGVITEQRQRFEELKRHELQMDMEDEALNRGL